MNASSMRDAAEVKEVAGPEVCIGYKGSEAINSYGLKSEQKHRDDNSTVARRTNRRHYVLMSKP